MHDTTEEIWRYCGARVLARGGVADLWLPPNSDPALFKNTLNASNRVVGAEYKVRVVRTGDNVSMYGSPVYHRSIRDDDTLEWRALHRAAKAEHDATLTLRKDAKMQSDNPTLEELRGAYRLARGKGRTQLLAWVMTQITR